jgi:hypothetical protein
VSATRAASLFIATLCLASPARAQMTVTVDRHLSIAEVGSGGLIQGPRDVNQQPDCGRLGLPCVSPRTIPDFGVALLGTIYPSEIVGIAGEFAVFENAWVANGTNCGPAGGQVPPTCPVSQINHGRAALAGLKVRTRLIKSGATNWRLFGQVLSGPQWTDVTARRRVLQPGVGADDYLRNGITLHVQYDYTFAPGETRDMSTGRFLVGVALPIGARR